MPHLHSTAGEEDSLEGLRNSGAFGSGAGALEVISSEWELRVAVKAREEAETRALKALEREASPLSGLPSLSALQEMLGSSRC